VLQACWQLLEETRRSSENATATLVGASELNRQFWLTVYTAALVDQESQWMDGVEYQTTGDFGSVAELAWGAFGLARAKTVGQARELADAHRRLRQEFRQSNEAREVLKLYGDLASVEGRLHKRIETCRLRDLWGAMRSLPVALPKP